MSVDWRNRFGQSYITTATNQGFTNFCWGFAATALVESMVRIEHNVWCVRSEGDMMKGLNWFAFQGGWHDPAAFDFLVNNGLADHDCFPFSEADAPYTHPYSASADRRGRAVRLPVRARAVANADQKTWLSNVGPLVAAFEVFEDFDWFFWSGGTGVYKHTAGNHRGTHIVLVVGYDDAAGCWIAKNSWGPGGGEQGFFRIAYGECNIDQYAKYGLSGTNADPWSRRRAHAGGLIQSGNGAGNRNFELVVREGNYCRQYFYEFSQAKWYKLGRFGDIHAPGDADFGSQPVMTSSTFNRNFELVTLRSPGGAFGGRLRHWAYLQDRGSWGCSTPTPPPWPVGFGPTDGDGTPGFVQSNRGTPGDFEVVVRTSAATLAHWSRQNSPPWDQPPGRWFERTRFGNGVRHSGPALVQSRDGIGDRAELGQGRLEVVCVLNTGQMQHWSRAPGSATQWLPINTFGSGVNSPPFMIEGNLGKTQQTMGAFELCVMVNGQVQHWRRPNTGGGGSSWSLVSTFATNVTEVVGLMQASYGFDLEIVLRHADGSLTHWFSDAPNPGWYFWRSLPL